MENKRANVLVIGIVILLMFLLVLGAVMVAIGSTTINWVFDIAVPELTGLGMVGDANVTHAMDVTIAPVNTFVQNFTWVSGLIYIFGLIAIFGICYAFKSTGDKWLISLFFACVLILTIGCIFMSNIYQDIHDGNDTFAEIMREHVLLSFLIIYSPGIMTLLAFIAGIILFSGPQEGFV